MRPKYNADLMLSNGLKASFHHLSAGGKRQVTVAQIIQDDKIVQYGLSICNPEDSFNPVLGRQIALGRAIKKWWNNVESTRINNSSI